METLRILTALEDLLGSLGPQINIVMSRAITLENNKEGSANILLEDLDVAAILQMAKEKLSGQILAGEFFVLYKTGYNLKIILLNNFSAVMLLRIFPISRTFRATKRIRGEELH